MQALKIYQSLWAMALRQPGLPERSDKESFKMIADAGFHGVCLDPAVHEIQDCLAKQPLFEEHGLACLINSFPKTDDDLRALLVLSKELGSPVMNVIGVTYPLTAKEAAPTVRRWLDISDEVGVPILFETHRDCITNDMFFTLELLERVPEMRLCADFSHYAVNRELAMPVDAFWDELFDRLIKRSDSFQGRIASHEQIQVPIGFAQHQVYVEQFKNWWHSGMRQWSQRSAEDAELIFLCELGPPPYAITGADGVELSDRFEESLIIKSWIEEIWADVMSLRLRSSEDT